MRRSRTPWRASKGKARTAIVATTVRRPRPGGSSGPRRHHALLALLALCLIPLTASTARAASPEDDAHAELIARVQARYHVEIVPSRLWRQGELEAMERGLEAMPLSLLPDSALAPPRVERRREACLFGIGRDTRGCETFSEDGLTFYVYTLPPVQGEGATRTLRWLDEAERAELWRARAMVHLLARQADQRFGWSQTRRWRQINGWNRRGGRAFNRDPWGYSRYLGQRSAEDDLVTFAEEYFVRPEDVLERSTRPEAAERLEEYDWNLSLACQEFTKRRIFGDLLRAAQPSWEEPERGPQGAGARRTCEQFESWAMSQDVAGVDILLAAATSDRPESLYGHLLLTVRYREGQMVRSVGFDPVYQYGAITDTDVGMLEYFGKGLFGGFVSLIQPNTFRGTDRLFMQYEQRTLRRYALNLSPQQLRQVMERLWEAERRIAYPYYFLSDNCASMLIDLLAPALDEVELATPLRFGLMPTEVLDVFAAVDNGERGPLLVKRPQTHFSSREVAMDAVPRRREALAAISARSSELGRALGALDTSLDERDPEVRQLTYGELTALLLARESADFKPDQELARHVIDYLYYSTRVERYFMDLAFYRRRLIQAGALLEPIQFTAEEQVMMRRALFEEEDLLVRQEAMLAIASLSDDRLRDGERRAYTEAEQAELEGIAHTQAAYLASLKALASVIERYDPELNGATFLGEKTEAFERAQRRRDKLAMGPAGKGRFVLGGSGGALTTDQSSGLGVGALDLSASIVHERLGEQRRRGFRSDISSRALGLDASVLLGEDSRPLTQRLDLDLTLFEFMTVEQLLGPVRRTWRDAFGWGMKLAVDHDGRRGLIAAIHAEGGYVYPLWQRDAMANFLIIGLFGAARTAWAVGEDDPDLFGAKAFAMAQIHLYGAYANALRFEASTYQYGRFDALEHHWEVRGRVQTEHAMAQIGQQVLLLSPFVEMEHTTLDHLARQRGSDQAFSLWRAGLDVELPF